MRKPRIALEEHLIENVSRIEVGYPKERQFRQRSDALFCSLPQSLLTFRVEAERMHEICAHERAFEVVKCGGLSVFIHSGFVLCYFRTRYYHGFRLLDRHGNYSYKIITECNYLVITFNF